MQRKSSKSKEQTVLQCTNTSVPGHTNSFPVQGQQAPRTHTETTTHGDNSCSGTAHPESGELFDNLGLQHVFVDAVLFDANIAELTGIGVIDKHLQHR